VITLAFKDEDVPDASTRQSPTITRGHASLNGCHGDPERTSSGLSERILLVWRESSLVWMTLVAHRIKWCHCRSCAGFITTGQRV